MTMYEARKMWSDTEVSPRIVNSGKTRLIALFVSLSVKVQLIVADPVFAPDPRHRWLQRGAKIL